MSYDCTNRSAQSLAGLSQSVAVLRLLKEAGFTQLQKQEPDGMKEQVGLDWMADEVARRQAQYR